ncbi:MAG: dual OB domain-containing protein [Janthinobacterium lividum]
MVEMICLANSRKMQGHCVAGLRTDGQGWIRPVASTESGTLSAADCCLQDGSKPQLLDVIQIGCSEAKPEPHQPENWRIDKTRWQLITRPAPKSALRLLQDSCVKGPLLLGNFGDKQGFATLRLKPVTASLVLIAPESLTWQIKTSQRGNRQTKADFRLTHTPYSLSVTDPVWVQRLAHLPNGLYPMSAANIGAQDQLLFVISLSEPTDWDKCCYKLVAGVIEVKRQL